MTKETLFQEALAKPTAERAAFLDAACAGQQELRTAVEVLLAAHDALRLANTIDHQPQIGPGAVIAGRYTLIANAARRRRSCQDRMPDQCVGK
jgi:hypothetical protein